MNVLIQRSKVFGGFLRLIIWCHEYCKGFCSKSFTTVTISFPKLQEILKITQKTLLYLFFQFFFFLSLVLRSILQHIHSYAYIYHLPRFLVQFSIFH